MAKLIVAYAKNNVIGSSGRIPWTLPGDLEHFKQLTLGSVLIMGRRTFEEIFKKFGRGLSGRETIVLSKSQHYEGENYRSAVSLCSALALAKNQFPEKDIFICGGESVYREALKENLIEKMYITEIEQDFSGDAFFPEFNKKDFMEESRQRIDGEIPYSFVINSKIL